MVWGYVLFSNKFLNNQEIPVRQTECVEQARITKLP